MLALDQGTATVLVALITVVGGPMIALFVGQRRQLRELQAVSRAVNHVSPGEPPLIERVRRLERRSDTQTRWLVDVLTILAAQLGVKLPPHPSMEDEAA